MARKAKGSVGNMKRLMDSSRDELEGFVALMYNYGKQVSRNPAKIAKLGLFTLGNVPEIRRRLTFPEDHPQSIKTSAVYDFGTTPGVAREYAGVLMQISLAIAKDPTLLDRIPIPTLQNYQDVNRQLPVEYKFTPQRTAFNYFQLPEPLFDKNPGKRSLGGGGKLVKSGMRRHDSSGRRPRGNAGRSF